tara:strand:+ start:398 stop:1375 length:978 start_codon:yes stop_codon:yes gene_type:complete
LSTKKVLVAGGTGMIGSQLVPKLIKNGNDVTVVSMDSIEYARQVLGSDVTFVKSDLTILDNCLKETKGFDQVYNLIGIKGSVGIGESKVASYFVPMLRFQTNLMDAAFKNEITEYMFVSSICIYPQAEIHFEDNAWNGMPKQNDRIPGIAKRVGELQGETYLREYGWDAVKIIRPCNIYGPFDDFNPKTAQVIPALISRMLEGEDPIKVWGDGTVIRDFVFSEDLAEWMIVAMDKLPACTPINIGSGIGHTIKNIAEKVLENIPLTPIIEWDKSKPTGDPVRLLNINKAKELIGYEPKISIDEGLKKTISWYLENKNLLNELKVR